MTAAAPATSIRFSYQARDQRGQLVSGMVSAPSLPEATKSLRSEGKYIVDIRPAGAKQVAKEILVNTNTPKIGRIKREDVIHFTIQLSVMVDTGVPLSEALTSLSDQMAGTEFGKVSKAILNDVTAGKDFSSSLATFPKIFPIYYTSLVHASEVSGTMGVMLRKLADYLTSQREIAKRVRGALIYPSFMLVMSIGVTIFLLTAVLPRFTAIFASRKAALPMPTQILMNISDSLSHYWYFWVGGTALIVSGWIWFGTLAAGKKFRDFLKLNIPIFGPMFHKLYLARSLNTMGTMVTSGVQLMDALTIVRDVAGNSYYMKLWDEVHQKIQGGAQLSEPLLKSKLVPKSIAQMIHSGEKTGELPNVLARISKYLEEDLATAIKTTTQFIEPIMIGLMGILIGGVAIAMLLPILTISKVMSQ
jgi:type IV pilus assembly protein PilC